MGSKNKSLNLDKSVLIDLYINQQLSTPEIAKQFGCSYRTILNYLHKYDIKVRTDSQSIKIQSAKRTKQQLRQRAKKCYIAWKNKTKQQLQEIQKKKEKSGNINSHQAILKSALTKYKNHSDIKSKSQDYFYKQLTFFFDQNDIIRSYVDQNRYPFNCDFYIKSKDLFIEYQGHYTHGQQPYDENNEQHKKYLIQCENKKLDMSTWIKRDPNKLKIAKQNNLNLLLIYPRKTSYLLKNKQLIAIQLNELDKI